jgi:hypothetical protein
MFEKVLKGLGLLCLFVFSFFYTEKVATVVKNQDPIMVKINEYSNTYNIEPANAIIYNNDLIPGLNGCIVDTNRSYYNMKRNGYYNVNMIEYKEIKPDFSVNNVYDKYIIKGNKEANEVALLFKINSTSNITDIISYLKEKKIKVSFFLDGTWIENNKDLVSNIVKSNHEIYNLGYDNKYDKNYIEWTNNLIEAVSHNKSNYCLILKEDNDILNLCSKYHMHTIKSDLLINSSHNFNNIKNNIMKGSIITFDTNSTTITELNNTILYLNKKGFLYNTLSKHLSEKRCE